MKLRRVLAFSQCIVFVLPLILIAAGKGTVRGKVTLGDEKDVTRGVNVILVGQNRHAVTGTDGRFLLSDVEEGIYGIDVRCIGYKQQRVLNVRVVAGQTTEIDVSMEVSPFLLHDVVVTGSLSKHLLKDTPVITEIISQHELASAGSSDLGDIIRAHTGIEITTSIGQTQSARLNGLNKNQVLVLIDGERISGKVDGAVDLGQIPVNMIEKIEVVKGPLSSTYGTDALGGVINVITKDPKAASLLHMAVSAGSYGRRDFEISSASVFDSLIGEHRSLRLYANAGWSEFGGVDYNERDYVMELPSTKRRNFDLKAVFELNGRFILDLKGDYYKDDLRWLAGGDRIVSFVDFAKNEKATVSGAGTYLLSNATSLRLTAHYSRNNHWSSEETASGAMIRSSLSREEVQTYRAQLTTAPYSSSVLSLGYESNGEAVNSARISRSSKATFNQVLYGEEEWTLSALTLSAGARFSRNSDFGDFFAPRVSVLYRVSDHMALRASYGRGFRAPSLLELYIDYDNSGVGYMVRGEPALRPEASHGLNAGLDYSRDDLVWFRINGYYNRVSDLIDYYRVPGSGMSVPVLSYRNISKATTAGADADVDLRPFPSVTIGIGYTYLSSKDDNGNNLPFHSPNSVNWRIQYSLEKYQAEGILRGRWYDRKPVTDDQVNTSIYSSDVSPQFSHIPAYMILDCRISKRFFDFLDLSGGVNNISDQTEYPFGQIRGREFFITLSYNYK